MSDDQKLLTIGAYLYAALALTGLFVLGLVVGDHHASAAAVASASLAYCGQVAATYDSLPFNIGFSLASFVMGFFGLALAVF